jgi:hypothetical protein
MSDGFDEFDSPRAGGASGEKSQHRMYFIGGFGTAAVFFFLLMILDFSIPYHSYRQAKSEFPDYAFNFPSPGLLCLHFFFGIFATSFFGLLAFCYWKDGGIYATTKVVPVLLIVTGIGSVGLWIGYAVYASRSPEYRAAANLMEIDTYQAYTEIIKTAVPGVEFSAKTTTIQSKWHCDFQPKQLLGTFENDTSDMPWIDAGNGQVWRVESAVFVGWDGDAKAKIKVTESTLTAWLLGKNQHGARWSVSTRDFVEGGLDQIIVSDNAETPKQFSKGKGAAAYVFWSGIVHALYIDAIPTLKGSIAKHGCKLDAALSSTDFVPPQCYYSSSSRSKNRNSYGYYDDYYY